MVIVVLTVGTYYHSIELEPTHFIMYFLVASHATKTVGNNPSYGNARQFRMCIDIKNDVERMVQEILFLKR